MIALRGAGQETRMSDTQVTKQSLENEVNLIIEEARMVLPGIQALFGFQLIAVFSDRFPRALPPFAQHLHLVATALVAAAIALIMAPAAYHRQAERDRLSRYFANYASLLITIALAPLLAAICIEIGLVAYAILGSPGASFMLGLFLALAYTLLWYVFPYWKRRQRRARV
jgi:hypothetical protein